MVLVASIPAFQADGVGSSPTTCSKMKIWGVCMGKMDLVCLNKECPNLDKEKNMCTILTQEDGLKRRLTCEERIWSVSSVGRARE